MEMTMSGMYVSAVTATGVYEREAARTLRYGTTSGKSWKNLMLLVVSTAEGNTWSARFKFVFPLNSKGRAVFPLSPHSSCGERQSHAVIGAAIGLN